MTTMENMQYQLANGNWVDCGEDAEHFLTLCDVNNAHSGITDRAGVVAALLAGEILRNDPADWYSKCRIKPESRPVPVVEMVRCDCGCQTPRGTVMNASMGTSCPGCYNRLSD